MVAGSSYRNLEGEQQEEGHHKTEQTHGLGESESQNGVGEELLLEAGVSRISDDERTEDGSNSSTRTGDSDGGSSGTDELGSTIDIALDRRGVQRSQRGQRTEGHWGRENQGGLVVHLESCWLLAELRNQHLASRSDAAGDHA